MTKESVAIASTGLVALAVDIAFVRPSPRGLAHVSVKISRR